MDGKPKNGFDRLKIKYAALQEKCNELQARIEQQQTTISKLRADMQNDYSEHLRLKVSFDRERNEMLEHMGWWKRFTWFADHKKGVD